MAAFTIVACCPIASAQGELPELPRCTTVDGPRRVLLEHESQPGLWFHVDVAECLLRTVEVARAALPYARGLERRISIYERTEARLRAFGELAERGEARALEGLESSEERRRGAEQALLSWDRSPVLWFVLGVVATVVVAGAGALIAVFGVGG